MASQSLLPSDNAVAKALNAVFFGNIDVTLKNVYTALYIFYGIYIARFIVAPKAADTVVKAKTTN